MRRFLIPSAILSALLVVGGLSPAHADEPEADAGGLSVPKLAVAPNFTTSSDSSAQSSTLPSTVDLTRWAVQPGDQGSTAACASWGIGYTMLGWYANKYGYSTTQFAPMYLYSQVHLSSAADGGGSYGKDNYKILETQGIAPRSAWTSADTNWQATPDAAARAAAAPYQASTYHTLFASTNPQGGVGQGAQEVIEAALSAGYPVGLGLPIYDALNNLNAQNYTLTLTTSGAESNYAGGHYVVALGYDSTGVIIENSWGSAWGRSGFAKIGWDFINKHAIEAEYIEGIFASIPAAQYKAPSDDMLLQTTTITPTSLKIHWYEPSTTGTTKLSFYTLKVVGGATNIDKTYGAGSAGYSLTNSGLTADTDYTYTMTATNTLGLSTSTQMVFHTSASGTVVGAVTPRATTFATGLSPVASDATTATPAPTPSATPTAEPSVALPSAVPTVEPSASEPTPSPSATATAPIPTPTLPAQVVPTPPAEPTLPTPSPTVQVNPAPAIVVAPQLTVAPTPIPVVPEPVVAPPVPPVAPTRTVAAPITLTDNGSTLKIELPSPAKAAVAPVPQPSAAPISVAPEPSPAVQAPVSEQNAATTPALILPKAPLTAGKSSITLNFGKSLLRAKAAAYSITVKKGAKVVQARTYKPQAAPVVLRRLARKTSYTVLLKVKRAHMAAVSKKYKITTR